MKALIYKDFIALKKSLLLLLLAMVLLGVYAYTQDMLMILPMIFILVPVILLGILFGVDTQAKVDKYIVPAPLSRLTIVTSRYLLVWLMAGIGGVLAVLITLTNKGNTLPLPWYIILPAMVLLISFISIVQLPLMYRFGAEKARLIFVLLYFSVFILFSLLANNKALISNLFEQLNQIDTSLLSLILTAIALIMNCLSFAISLAIYRKIEL